jgi:predicted site-specific integrase-resolvase
MQYVRTQEAARLCGVKPNTIRIWANNGKISCVVSPSGHRVFDKDSLPGFKSIEQEQEREQVIYARVSSRKQRDDLERQIAFLLDKYPGFKVISDVGSGLNYKRPNLLSLLQRVIEGRVQCVAVGSRDRLSRFGSEFFEWVFNQFNCKLLVQNENDKSPEQELVDDVLSILHVFNCRLQGRRRYGRIENKKDKDISNQKSKDNIEQMETHC